MDKYRVTWMTSKQYNDSMQGYMFPGFQVDYVYARTPAEAETRVALENSDCAVICGKTITLEQERAEQEARAAEIAAKMAAAEEKKAAAKARKIARDLANGITPEKRKALNNKKRYEGTIKRLREKITAMEEEIAEYERKMAYWAEQAEIL